MKLKDLVESAVPFVKYGAWSIFNDNDQIYGFTNFAVPKSGPALMAHSDSGDMSLLLSIDPDGMVAPRNKIIVSVVPDGDAISFKKTWPDTPDGYREAKKFAEKLRKGQDPTS